MIPTIFILAGIGLCISRHPIWGVICFVAALLAVAGQG